MNFEEFLKPDQKEEDVAVAAEPIVEEEVAAPEEIEVQKAVVESLAADKAAQDEELSNLKGQLAAKSAEIESLKAELAGAKNALAKIDELSAELASAKAKLTELEAKEYDMQERNPNALALLDRDVEIGDRFPGETRDHVLEVIKEARDRAEGEGRERRAQVLESVLIANEPNGTLASRRNDLIKLFTENANVVNGTVISELERLGISHKKGESYLLPSEIIARAY